MILVIRKDSKNKDIDALLTLLVEKGCRVRQGHAGSVEVWELTPDDRAPAPDFLKKLPCVAGVVGGELEHPLVSKLSEGHEALEALLIRDGQVDPEKLNQDYKGNFISHQSPGFKTLSERSFHIIAGPCSFTKEDNLLALAMALREAGATAFRGGSYKPRTSPYSYHGMGKEGLQTLTEAGRAARMTTVSEIMEAEQLPLFKDVDILQVGARNMQNFSLLKALGQQDKPVLLKKGMGNTVEELLNSAEYLAAGGNNKILLCERGSVSFDADSQVSFNLNNIPILKGKTKLPVIADPSHGTARADLVKPMALAAAAAGADGIMVEVHEEPSRALSDAGQALTLEEFEDLSKAVSRIVSSLD